jgi:hypothetical protein
MNNASLPVSKRPVARFALCTPYNVHGGMWIPRKGVSHWSQVATDDVNCVALAHASTPALIKGARCILWENSRTAASKNVCG